MRKIILTVLGVILILGGCAHGYNKGPEITDEKLAQLIIGETRKSEVIVIFGGMPTNQIRNGDGSSSLTWAHTRIKRDFIFSQHDVSVTAITCIFDKDGILQNYSMVGHQNMQETWVDPGDFEK